MVYKIKWDWDFAIPGYGMNHELIDWLSIGIKL